MCRDETAAALLINAIQHNRELLGLGQVPLESHGMVVNEHALGSAGDGVTHDADADDGELHMGPNPSNWLYIDDMERIQGPFDEFTMRRWFVTGFFHEESLVLVARGTLAAQLPPKLPLLLLMLFMMFRCGCLSSPVRCCAQMTYQWTAGSSCPSSACSGIWTTPSLALMSGWTVSSA